MMESSTRREWMVRGARGVALAAAGLAVQTGRGSARTPETDSERLARETLDFIVRCRREDGGYAPSPDPAYAGRSDTSLSDLAGVTYAAVLARTLGWSLPDPKRSVAFIARHQ